MNTMSLRKRVAYALAPLAVLLLIDMVPVTHADLADAQAPSDVENLKAAPADGAATLTWDVATDNVGVKGYKLYYGTKSVTADGGSYEKGPVDMGNKITYTVNGLTNGTKYYMAVTAYDAAGNESESYSLEAPVTPAASLKGAADKEAPKVTKAEALDKTHVRVTFNEGVKLPAVHPENAFTIKNDTTGVQLTVKNAGVDAGDLSSKTVMLETSPQTAAAHYVLTAGIDVKDMAGNPIVSGTSDTAPFVGTDAAPVAPVVPAQPVAGGLSLSSVGATDGTHVLVVFSKPVILKKNPVENFIITEEKAIENTLDVTAVTLSADGLTATLTTAPMKSVNYNLIAVDVVDDKGAPLSVENNATVFMGVEGGAVVPPAAGDVTPPEDVTNFMASLVKKLVVTLNWTRSLNSAGDLAKYVLYMGTDAGAYGAGIDVDPTSANFDVTNIVPGVKYFFKLVAVDKTGNASHGVETTFVLPKTGPELGLLLLGSLGAGKWLKRKKKVVRK